MEHSFFNNHGSYAHALCPRSRLWLMILENRERKGLFETLMRSVKKSNNRGQDALCRPEEVQRRLERSHARAERLWKQGW